MDAGIYSAVSGSVAALTRLDAITNNLANASTPGFKAERFVQHAETTGSSPTSTASLAIPEATVETDFSQGPIEPTGNALDVALSGDGFFVVDGPHGQRLTRRGNLRLDAEGYLATSDGARLQGTNGDLHVGPGEIAIGPDGTVRAGEVSAGKLRVVTVADPAKLVREGGTTFDAGKQPLTDVGATDVQVIQGALEGANLSPIESLVALVDTMRGFEAYMRAAERLDQVSGKAIGEVGRV